MVEKSYLHQNGVELNFLLIGMASGPAISLRINPHIRKDSKGVMAIYALQHHLGWRTQSCLGQFL